MELSIVIIGKNSSHTLARAFQSIEREIERHFILSETIYVDSSSIDSSVKIASKYGAKIIEIFKGFTSAALGRKLGIEFSQGKYILLMDADMELEVGTLSKLLNLIEHNAVLIPERREILYDNQKIKSEIPNFKGNIDGNLKAHCFKKGANSIGGFMLLRSEVLKKGSFNKNLRDEEEADFIVHLPKKSIVYFSTLPGFLHHNRKSTLQKIRTHLSPTGNIGYIQGLILAIKNGKLNRWLKVQCKYGVLILLSIAFWILIFNSKFLMAGSIALLAVLIPGFGILGAWANLITFPYKLIMSIIDTLIPKKSWIRYPDDSVVEL